MNYYETLYIVHPALEAGRLKDIIINVEKTITKIGGHSIHIDVWGKKKMAYSINKEKYGTYVLFQFQNETTQNENFNLELKHNPNILGFLTTCIPENEVKMEKEDLDTQLGVNKTNNTVDEDTSSDIVKPQPKPVTVKKEDNTNNPVQDNEEIIKVKESIMQEQKDSSKIDSQPSNDDESSDVVEETTDMSKDSEEEETK